MTQVQILPPAAKFLKKLKDKKLNSLYKEAIKIATFHRLLLTKSGCLFLSYKLFFIISK